MQVNTRSFYYACQKVFEPGHDCEEKLIRTGLPAPGPSTAPGSELVLSLLNELGFQ